MRVRHVRHAWLSFRFGLFGSGLVALASLASIAALEGVAHAAPNGFALNRFEPADHGSSWFVLDSVALDGPRLPAAGALLDYQNRPLAIHDATGSERTAIVGHVLTTHVGASMAFWNRVRFGVSLPVILSTGGDGGSLQGVTYRGPSDEQAVGDFRLGADVRVFGAATKPLTVAVGARFWAPTGSTQDYTGDGGVRAGPRVSAAGQLGKLNYGASIGITFRDAEASSFAGAPINHELPFALSAGARLDRGKLLVGPELYGSTVLSDAFKTRTTPLELLLGGHYMLGGGFRAGVGAGTGLVSGFGAPQLRVLGSFEWAPQVESDADGDGIPDADDMCPGVKGARSTDAAKNGCPAEVKDEDTDGDGVLDRDDACPDVYGHPSSDKRTNGCADHDGDGVADPIDACPDVAGDQTNNPQTNGCPPPPGDKDNDGILDNVDACPDKAGLKDPDPELNGCPDPDPDHDGIGNDLDACPDLPGTADPDPKKNGCPMAFVRGNEIMLKQAIPFKIASEVLGTDSASVLQAVADLLRAHPEITKLTIDAHTDNRGSPGANKKLSTLRAAAVANWLAAHGVDRTRLASAGHGGDVPIEPNDTEAGREANRRIELHIEQAAPAPAPAP